MLGCVLGGSEQPIAVETELLRQLVKPAVRDAIVPVVDGERVETSEPRAPENGRQPIAGRSRPLHFKQESRHCAKTVETPT